MCKTLQMNEGAEYFRQTPLATPRLYGPATESKKPVSVKVDQCTWDSAAYNYVRGY